MKHLLSTSNAQSNLSERKTSLSDARCKNYSKYSSIFRSLAAGVFLIFLSPAIGLAQGITVRDANGAGNGITQGSLTLGQKNIVLFGFGIKAEVISTLTEMNVGIFSPDSRNNYFSNFRIIKSADSVHSFDDIQLGITASWKKNNLSSLSISLSDELADTSKASYYFLVADYSGNTGTVPGTIQFNFSTTQKSSALITSGGSYNNFNLPGTTFSMNPPTVAVSSNNSGTNGITPSLITFNQKGIVLFGFGVNVQGVSTISQFNISSTNNIGSYFSNGKLYRSTDNVFSMDDALIASINIGKNVSTNLAISNLSESFDWSPIRYYFLVADYTTNGPVLNNTIKLQFKSAQTAEAVVQSAPQKYSYNNFDIDGQTFVFARTTIWLGNALLNPANWNNAENWSGGYVPGTTDIAYLGTQSFLTQPVVSANASIGAIHLGTAQSVTLTVDSAATLSAGDVIFRTANASVTDSIRGAGNLLVNNFQLSEPTTNPVLSVNQISKIVSSIANLRASNIILRSKANGSKNDAVFEVSAGTVSVTGSIQTIHTSAANTATFYTDSSSVIHLSAANPFLLSATGSNAITHRGVTAFNGALAQNISGKVNFKDLILSGDGVKTIEATIPGPFNLAGNLTITAPARINYSPNITSINVRGNFSGNSALNSGALPVYIGRHWLNTTRGPITGTVNYDGPGDQTVAGLQYTNVNFLNGGIKSLSDSASVSTTLTVGANTILYTANKLTLRADASSNANIAPLLNGADVQGKVIVQSHIKGGKRGNVILSSPIYETINSVKAFPYRQLKSHMPVTGNGGPTNGFDEGAAVNPNGFTIRNFVESASPSQTQYLSISHIDNTIGPGFGFVFFFRGDRSNIYNKVNAPFITPEDVVYEHNGEINKGDIILPLSYTYYSGATDNGFNLVGNPYPSTIDLQKLLEGTPYTRTWILKQDNTYAVYDPALGTGTNGASRYLVPGQGFFVQASEANQTLTFTEACKVTSMASTRTMGEKDEPTSHISALAPKTGDTQYIKLKAQKSDIDLSDETIIAFKSGSSSNKDSEDAVYLSEASVVFGSLSTDNELLAINYLPAGDSDTEVKLNLTGETGSYNLSLSEKAATGFSDILLVDNYSNKIVSLISEPVYNFSIDKAISNTHGNTRFKIVFRKPSQNLVKTDKTAAMMEGSKEASLLVYPNPVEDELRINLSNNIGTVKMKIYSISGKEVMHHEAEYAETIIQNVSVLGKGHYILKLIDAKSDSVIGTEKFIKQ
ncbi:T9SS type A sorting domain-containing protein [Paradesertivirga mongoliensis]|uniref:T9SS type A sorting domain-containing protein n=1 Tax=Paradesertivirga mongoliensis TaxID=2100740 RepID=A0ABW4ZJC9_9SPHI|nr:T9SS type A sorting domain-containing protein [Pedobacter mongoliensis]